MGSYEREFETDEFTITVSAHFSSRQSGDVVDKLALIQIDEGEEAEAVEFVAKLQRLYVGKPVSAWIEQEFDDDA